MWASLEVRLRMVFGGFAHSSASHNLRWHLGSLESIRGLRSNMTFVSKAVPDRALHTDEFGGSWFESGPMLAKIGRDREVA